MTIEAIDMPLSMSAQDKIEELINLIEANNPKLHAVSDVFATEARARARDLDHIARSGKPTGPLHGLPILFKELIDIAGKPTRFGSLTYTYNPALRNAPIIDRLEAAGAIILGTTHMVEFAVGSWGTNAVRGTPRNPADMSQHRVPGGSSSGSAVAVAAGFAPIAFGSDTGGSIRIPASLCGVIGFKPSYGLIPLQGVAPTGPTFDTLGPVSRTVTDARRATEVAAGISLHFPEIDLAGLKVAHVSRSALAPIEQRCSCAYDQAVIALSKAGAEFTQIDMPGSFVELQAINGDIVAFEAYSHFKTIVDDSSVQMDPHVRDRVQKGAAISPATYHAHLKALQDMRDAFSLSFADSDILLLPGTPITSVPLDDVDETQIPMSRYTRAANCLNLCAIAMPLLDPDGGLPVGIQLASRAGQDAKLLAIAEAFEKLNVVL